MGAGYNFSKDTVFFNRISAINGHTPHLCALHLTLLGEQYSQRSWLRSGHPCIKDAIGGRGGIMRHDVLTRASIARSKQPTQEVCTILSSLFSETRILLLNIAYLWGLNKIIHLRFLVITVHSMTEGWQQRLRVGTRVLCGQAQLFSVKCQSTPNFLLQRKTPLFGKFISLEFIQSNFRTYFYFQPISPSRGGMFHFFTPALSEVVILLFVQKNTPSKLLRQLLGSASVVPGLSSRACSHVWIQVNGNIAQAWAFFSHSKSHFGPADSFFCLMEVSE